MNRAIIILLIITSNFLFSEENEIGLETNIFLDNYFINYDISEDELKSLKGNILNELNEQKIPLSVIDFMAKIMPEDINFKTEIEALKYLKEMINKADIMIRKGANPLKVRAELRQQVIKKELLNRENNSQRQDRLIEKNKNHKDQILKGQQDLNERGNSNRPNQENTNPPPPQTKPEESGNNDNDQNDNEFDEDNNESPPKWWHKKKIYRGYKRRE